MDSVYLMFNPWLPFRFKIGITNNVQRRAKENGALTMFNFRLPAARYVESGMHGFYSWAHWPASRRHSGRTEYFACVNPMAACVLYFFAPYLPAEYYAITLFLPVPIDAAAILYAIAAVVYGGAVVVLFGLAYLVMMW